MDQESRVPTSTAAPPLLQTPPQIEQVQLTGTVGDGKTKGGPPKSKRKRPNNKQLFENEVSSDEVNVNHQQLELMGSKLPFRYNAPQAGATSVTWEED